MTSLICYISENHLQKLKESVVDRIGFYRGNETPDWETFFEVENFQRISSIPMTGSIADRIQLPTTENSKDAENCIIVYESLNNLSPQQATDQRVWTYFTHFEALDYVQHRWPVPSDESKAEQAQKSVLAHYFVSGVRGLFRDNAISRLWWMGWIANRCSYFSVERTLEILLYQADVRANLLERSSFGMSGEIFNAVMKWLGESYQGEKSLFERKTFRDFMKHLNRRGGRTVLNTLNPDQLDDLIIDILKNNLNLSPEKL